MNWDCHFKDDQFILYGDWTVTEVEETKKYFQPLAPCSLVLNLTDVEIITGLAMAECVTWLRELSTTHSIALWYAPQMLAHTLYKANILQQGKITLFQPRYDRGIGA